MSIRAYKIQRLATYDKPIFNLSHDGYWLDEILGENASELIYVEKDTVEHELEEITEQQKDKKLSEKENEDLQHRIEVLQNILEAIGDDDGAEFVCY